MKSIGVIFDIWKKKDTNQYDWTSLMGRDKGVMLRKLPELFHLFLNRMSIESTKKLWQVIRFKCISPLTQYF